MKRIGTSKLTLKRNITGVIFILPAICLFCLFVIYPSIEAIRMSFFQYGMKNSQVFTGADNYVRMLTDKRLIGSLQNTFKYVVFIVPLTLVISLFISVRINEKKRWAASFYRVGFYIPTIASAVTVSLIWDWIFNPVMGLMNYVLSLFGVNAIAWLADPKTAFYAIVIVILTTAIGQPVLLFSAAIGAIPNEYYEAAKVDGASGWQVFCHITLPCLRPTCLYVLVITTINAFQTFVPVQVLTGGGPQGTTSTMVYELYSQAFINGNYGYAASIGVLLFLIIGAISLVQFKLMFNREQEMP